MAKYKRVLLKLSGESLMGEKQYGIDEKRLAEYAAQIKEIHEQGVQIGIVIGGGNIFRGLSGANKGFRRIEFCLLYFVSSLPPYLNVQSPPRVRIVFMFSYLIVCFICAVILLVGIFHAG